MKKTEIRDLMKDKRRSLSPGELQRISDDVCHNLFSHFQLEKKKISLFLPIERFKEINTYKIWEKAMNLEATVAVPKTNMDTLDIKQVLFEEEAQLEISPFGIPEPKKGRVIAAEHFDIILVPLLAFDEDGRRIGYGKGIYDRFLKKCSPRCQFIGLCHFEPIGDKIDDMHALDVKLHACVTPEKVYRFG